ncbi:MAG: tRNA pseudouridine(38-40) synthase TruA [Acidobacteria bacterium RBG_13_68_16]|nr:MAG: tRNA pseudouridine(38-40) synthase TruA [Acidobacteria bacterium RBG_13_68_16]
MESSRLALKVSYLGGPFAGWQRQARARTVQGVLEQALETLYRRPVSVVGAGRTDAGVHAAGQVAHFDAPLPIPPAGVVSALNSLLPEDVRVLRAWRVPAEFHARRSALGKRYSYRLACGAVLPPWENLRRWQVNHSLDASALARGLSAVLGEHDFAAFALSGHSGRGVRGTVRVVTLAHLRVRGRRLDIVLDGDGFLRGMVRRIVGGLVEVGRGAQPPSWLVALLLDRRTGPPAPTAPPHGLTLERVYYRRQ